MFKKVCLLAALAVLAAGCSDTFRDEVQAPTAQEQADFKAFHPRSSLQQGVFHMQRVSQGSQVRVTQDIKLKHPELPPFDVAYVSRDLESVLLELANAAGESIVIPKSLRGKTVTVIHSGSDFRGMLDIVLSKAGYSYNYVDGVWYITRYPVRNYQLEISQSKRVGSLSSVVEPGREEADTQTQAIGSSGATELNTDYEDKIWDEVESTVGELVFVGSDVPRSQRAEAKAQQAQAAATLAAATAAQGFSANGELVTNPGQQVQLLPPPTLGDGSGKPNAQAPAFTTPTPVAAPSSTDHLSPDDVAEPFFLLTKSAGVITVRAAPEAHRLVEEYLEQVQLALQRQIYVEARIVAVVRDKETNRGGSLSNTVDLGNPLSRTILANIGFKASDPVTANSVVGGFMNLTSPEDDISLVLQLLSSIGDVYTLSSPSVMVRNNQLSRVAITQQIGYAETTVETNTNSAGETVIGQRTDEARFKNAGTVFSIIPFIGKSKVQMRVRLTIANQSGEVEVRTAVSADADGAVVNRVPQLTTNLIDQDMIMDYGRVYAVGGIVQSSTSDTSSYVPGFSQVPGMSEIFSRAVVNKKETEFVVLMRVSRA